MLKDYDVDILYHPGKANVEQMLLAVSPWVASQMYNQNGGRWFGRFSGHPALDSVWLIQKIVEFLFERLLSPQS